MLATRSWGWLAVMVLAGLSLSACESMSESQCRVADWGRVGFGDGAAGVSEQRLADYAKDCGKIGVRPDARAYRLGWDAGIQRYCTAANGWRAGTAGREHQAQVCVGQPGHETFVRSLNAGLQVYRTQQQIDDNLREIDRLQKRLDHANSDDERRHLRRLLHNIDQDQYRLRVLIGQQQLMAPR